MLTSAKLHSLECTLVRGHQIASGKNPESPYPDGSVVLQFPLLKKLGLDLEGFHPATLNLSISPLSFELTKADHCFENLSWIEGFHPETFSFVQCEVEYQGKRLPAYVYYPHPETKSRDFHNSSLIEVIAPLIPGIKYGQQITLHYDPKSLKIQKSNPC